MPVPLDALRVAVGALCVFFAYFLGRSAVRVYRGRQKHSRLIAWTLRTAVAAAGVWWRSGADHISLAVLILAALSGAAGVYEEWRPRHQEEPPRIFRED